MQVEPNATGGDAMDRDLTLSERVAWTNAFERRMRRDEDGYVLELDVYPVGDDPGERSGLPAPAFKRGLSHRFLRRTSGSSGD
jgi:hypothetical protein